MLQFWGGPLTRSTKDIDLLGEATRSVDVLVDVIKSCLGVEVENDGIDFDLGSLVGEEIRLDANYNGVRIRGRCGLDGARATFQIDIGFGDVITPGAVTVTYPTLLESKAPTLRGYTPETAIAEKLQAMVALDMANTRLKDFLDVWVLLQGREFEGQIFAEAIRATFVRRQTPLPNARPIALTPAFHSADERQKQWTAYVRKARVQGDVPTLDTVAEDIASFVMPVIEALVGGDDFRSHWPRGGPWRE